MRQTRKEILQKDIDECYNILEYQKIEQSIAFELGDTEALKEIGATIISYNKRIPILKRLLEIENQPPQEIYDFQGTINIRKG